MKVDLTGKGGRVTGMTPGMALSPAARPAGAQLVMLVLAEQGAGRFYPHDPVSDEEGA